MFSKLSGPAWAFVTASGLVIGTPLVADLGTNAFKVRVTDSHQASADVTVVVQVVPGKPPRWLQDPINLGNAPIEQFFQFNLASYAKDDDGNPLHFKLVIGPAWLVVSDIGLVTGTPHSANLGDYTAIFEVTNGMATAQAGGYGKVFDDSAPPIIVGKALVFSVKERETLLANLNSPQYVTEPHGLTMTFQILETADFVNLTTVGALPLKPIHKDLGEHTYTLKVTNSKNQSSQAPMLVHVLENPHPAPAWLADPIRMEAKVNTPFNNTLSDKAKSPDGLALTFSKKSGPTWLTVAAGGALSGTPLRADIGDNAFTVAVTDGAQSADATLIVTVKSETPTNDQIQVDQAVPGAASENLWVVDNSWYQHFGHNTQMDALAANLHYYYEALDAAQIHHTGVFISSDPKDFKGLPIKAGDSTPLMKWDDANLLHRFFVKMDATFNRYGCNSPLWSMFQLYKQAPGLSEIFHNGFWTADVPMDALIVTIHGDAYRSYSSHSQQANFKPDDYAKNFIDFANAQQQSYRISAVAPHCVVAEEPPPLEGGETKPRTREDVPIVEGQGNGENPYRVLVNRTRGTYYVWDSCNTNMRKVLQDYAQKVIFRAYVTAKHRIKLSKTPVDVKAITLTIGNNAIAGNTGAASDKWYYDAATNEVVVRWNLFDMSTIKAGDMIVISYKY